LACTTDGGGSWTARPGLRLPVPCDPSQTCPTGSTIPATTGATLASDGSILVEGPVGPMRDGILQTDLGPGIYSLAPGSDQWEARGPMAQGAVVYPMGPTNGAIWSFGGRVVGLGDASVDIVSHVLFVATYP
jgi:hypothetical protein